MPASLGDKEYSQTQKNIDVLFAEKNAKLLHKDEWGRMGLAYKIKGSTEGRYIMYYYEIAPDNIPEIDKGMRLEKGVLRHLFTKIPEDYKLVDWAAHFATWKKEGEKRAEQKEEEREEALKKKIVKRAAKKTVEPVSAPVDRKKKESLEEEELEEKLGELISDEDLNL